MKARLGDCVLASCLALGLAVFSWAACSAAQDNEKKKTTGKKVVLKDEDVTDLFRKYNSDRFLSPPTKFRKGHVTARSLKKDAWQKSESGFVVQLPRKAPIPTPTYYDGNVYISGGFHSKEYYCLDAAGKFVWGITLDDDGPSTAVCEDGICVFNTESCTIFAVDAKTGKHLWSHWLGDPLMSTPAIANGKVFTSYPASAGGGAFNDNVPQAQLNVNPKQGGFLQQKNASSATPKKKLQSKSAPQPDDQKEKAVGKKRPPCSHVLACLDLKTGKILWQNWIDSDVMSAPVIDGNEVYATSFAGTVYKFDDKTGKILSAIQSRATSAPVIVGKDVYFTRRADGADAKVAEEAISRVERKGGKVIFADGNKTRALHLDRQIQSGAQLAQKGEKLDADNGFAGGAPMAANPNAALENIGQGGVYTCQAFQGSRILNHGKWNFNCQGDELYCTDASSGKQKWSTKLKGDLKKVGGSLAAPPIMAGGYLFTATVSGEVLQIDPVSGETVKAYSIGAATRTQPIIQDGKIYVGTVDGKLVCIQTGNPELTGWSTWGGNSAHTGTTLAKQ